MDIDEQLLNIFHPSFYDLLIGRYSRQKLTTDFNNLYFIW